MQDTDSLAKIIFMKKSLLPLFAILLFTACQKEISMDKASEKNAGADENKQAKILVCHYDAATGISKTIEINANALAGHLEHGDLQGDCSTVLTTICHQDWMVKNLDVDHYKNGDPIPQVTDQSIWMGLKTGAWCYYTNDPANGAIYGKLYNWYAVNDPRGLAPRGWHVPTDAEWTKLEDCLGGWKVAGGKIKSAGTFEAGTSLWFSPNTGATNSSGFTGLPGGIRTGDGAIDFSGIHRGSYWYSSTEFSTDRAWSRHLFSDGNYLQSCHEQITPQPCSTKWMGLSVRCARN